MTTHDRGKVIAAARMVGAKIDMHGPDERDDIISMHPDKLTHFYAIAFEAGRQSVDTPVALAEAYRCGEEAGRQAEREERVGIYKSLLNLYLDRGYPEQQMAFLLAAIDDFIAAIRARSTK